MGTLMVGRPLASWSGAPRGATGSLSLPASGHGRRLGINFKLKFAPTGLVPVPVLSLTRTRNLHPAPLRGHPGPRPRPRPRPRFVRPSPGTGQRPRAPAPVPVPDFKLPGVRALRVGPGGDLSARDTHLAVALGRRPAAAGTDSESAPCRPHGQAWSALSQVYKL
jgi:hypothetical protein